MQGINTHVSDPNSRKYFITETYILPDARGFPPYWTNIMETSPISAAYRNYKIEAQNNNPFVLKTSKGNTGIFN